MEITMKNLWVLLLVLVAIPCHAGEDHVFPTAVAKRSAVRTIKSSDAWVKMDTQLSQYTNHLSQFNALVVTTTNKIESVSDANTKAALNKMQNEIEKLQQMLDDTHDAVVKMKKVLIDSVEMQQ